MRCECCERELAKSDDYIKYEDERFCSNCYESEQSTLYFIEGEYLATDDDGVEEYGGWNEEEAE